MSASLPQPRPLPKSPFLLGQGLLGALGAVLLFLSPEPWAPGTLLLVLLAVLAGTGLALVPFLWEALPRSREGSRPAVSGSPGSSVPPSSPAAGEIRWSELGEEIAALRGEVRALGESPPAGDREGVPGAPSGGGPLGALKVDVEALREGVEVLRSHQASRSFVEAGFLRQEERLRRLEARQEELYRLVRRIGPVGGPLATAGTEPPAAGILPGGRPGRPGEAEPAPGEPPPPAGEGAAEPEDLSLPTRLRVSAFLPPDQRVCLRGEGPGFPAARGVPLTMTGVGEWTWEGTLDHPSECELLLDDAVPSDLGRIRLYPGDDLILTPSFPAADEPADP